jgi:glycosyltransferase involved in cell wall biosynthesis
MRILYLTAFYPPDFSSGATMAVQRMAERSAAAGNTVHVFSGAVERGMTQGEVEREVVNGVTVHWIGSNGWTDPSLDVNWENPVAAAAVARLLDELNPDIVHAHTLQTLGAGPVAEALTRGIRTLVTMHDLWWWCALLFLVDKVLRPCTIVTDVGTCPCARDAPWRTARAAALRGVLDRVDEVLVPSDVMRDLAIANGVDPDRITVDANDVDTAATGAAATAEDPVAPGSTASDDGTVRFVFIGGDHPLKGTDVLLAAAAQLRQIRGWTLTMYGVEPRATGPSPTTTAIRFEPAFAPSRRERVLADADVLVIASIARESFSVAAREGLGAGLAVITTDCLGPEEVVHDGRNGLVVPAGDAERLADAMRSLVDDPTLLGAMRTAARSSPISLRAPDEHAASLLERYRTPRPATARPAVGRVVYLTRGVSRHGRVRAEHGAEALNMHGAEVSIVDVTTRAVGDLAAAAFVILQDLEATTPLCDAISQARSRGATVLYDASEAGFDGDDDVASDRLAMMAMSDGVLAPTRSIAARAEVLARRPALVVANAIGIEEIRVADAARRHRRKRLLTRGPMLVAVVPPHVASDWEDVEAELATLLERHRKWRLQVLGDVGHLRGLDRIGRRVRHETLHDWHSLPARLAGADAVLAPFTAVLPTHDSATITTWLSASLAGSPLVTVAAGDVRGTIRHGTTALVAKDIAAWGAHIESLVDDPGLGRRIAGAARRDVLLHHGPHALAFALLDALVIAASWTRA